MLNYLKSAWRRSARDWGWVMPCDYKKYPEEWKKIREEILERAKDRCELCNAPNGVKVVRHRDRTVCWEVPTGRCNYDSAFYYLVKVVLTVAHVDQDINNNEPWNLLALCQRCHNKIDLPHRIKNRRKNAII